MQSAHSSDAFAQAIRGDALRRVPDADARLTAFARKWNGSAFEWGRCDCTLLVAHAVDALAGTNFAALYTDRWHDEKSAREFQSTFGCDAESVLRDAGAIDAFDGRETLAERAAMLRRGDLILARLGGFCCGHVAFGALSLSVSPGRPAGWRSSAHLLALRGGAVILRVP